MGNRLNRFTPWHTLQPVDTGFSLWTLYHGSGRLLYFRPISAASCPPAPIMTPS